MHIPCSKSWKDIFVTESSLIDPQPGYPCDKPGDIMYDNHIKALELALSDSFQISPSTALDIHRVLTRGIGFLEDYNASGQYRIMDVTVGGDTCPPSYLLKELMDNVWYPTTKRLIDRVIDGDFTAIQAAWISHHIFEIIHPFLDGNGRTGRIILNKVMNDCGADPLIIYFEDRFIYYDSIEKFRKEHFDGKKFINLQNF